ncbi:hypothetical protein BGX26_002684 [Mortierella sp. AD094]|nr:hypothetical protein BGX26_002684 [Mortierella sp. AD094]
MVGEEAIEAFWTACMNLEDLSLSKVSFSAGFTIDTQVTFPKMKLLGLADIENMDNSMQLDIIRRCPRLEELTWYLEYPGQSMKLLGEYVGETLWPNLGGLSLGYRISDENLATIINSSRRITKLNLYRCHLEYPSFHALRRHFDTLVELSFRISPDVMGYMIIEVLCSCRHLKELKAKSILARDVVNGKPWVCTSLTYLQICFEFDKSEQNLQPLVFERLSHLVNLRTFGVGSWITWGSVSFQEALDLRLESGLGALANMKDIRHLNICDTTQSLSKDDVRWILANWRRLEIVSGKLSQVPFIHRELADMFRDRGIKA